MSDSIKIRAHHLFCLKGFQGYGYSEKFVDNMRQLKELVEHNCDLEVEIVNQTDFICGGCPHSVGGVCNLNGNSGQEIKQMDDTVLAKLNMQPGIKVSAPEIFQQVEEIFKTRYDLTGICLDCRWHEKCLWYLSRFAFSP